MVKFISADDPPLKCRVVEAARIRPVSIRCQQASRVRATASP